MLCRLGARSTAGLPDPVHENGSKRSGRQPTSSPPVPSPTCTSFKSPIPQVVGLHAAALSQNETQPRVQCFERTKASTCIQRLWSTGMVTKELTSMMSCVDLLGNDPQHSMMGSLQCTYRMSFRRTALQQTPPMSEDLRRFTSLTLIFKHVRQHACQHVGFPEIGVPPVIIHFNGMSPYKPSMLGYPHAMETPIFKQYRS